MVSNEVFLQLVQALPDVEVLPHFDVTSFRVKKKIFATLNLAERRCCLKLPLVEQSVFCAYDKEIIWEVDNKWGKQGWTLCNLKKIRKSMLLDALGIAYAHVAGAKGKK